MKFKLFLFLIFLFFSCGDNKPIFYPELTDSYIPKEGILPHFKGDVMDSYWPENGNFPLDLKKIPAINLIAHTGEKVSDQTLLNKYKIITFFYAKCNGICPMITRNMVNFIPKIQNASEIQILSISVNPNEDNREVLNKFRNLYRITNYNWLFLNGSEDSIYDLARNQFGAEIKVLNGKKNLTDFVHTENVYLIDKENYLRGIYRAKGPADLERLRADLNTLRK